MNSFVNAVASNAAKSKKDALTANGAVTRSTSGQVHLDLFGMVGAARNDQAGLAKAFSVAYAADKELALRIMLWARDVRGGAGERESFRLIMRQLATSDPAVLDKLVPYVAEFGRWDDVISSVAIGSNAFKIVAKHIVTAINAGNGLAAKWMPRKGDIAVALRKEWGMTPKLYRKFLVLNTNVVETKMCAKDWSSIEFDKLPSVASMRYQAAFARNAAGLFEMFKAKLVTGEVKVNATTLFPHGIVSNIRNGKGDEFVLGEQWKALPDFLGDKTGKVLVMSDVSGSMGASIGGQASCLDVSIALGLYTSERLKGPFKDVVLTFSERPALHIVQGVSIAERVRNLSWAQWDMNTNLQAAFALVLKTGVDGSIPAADMPETIVVISDMEFDRCTGNKTNFGGIKEQFAASGYKMPQLVFWNVNAKAGNNPVKYDAKGTCMVSGYSPSILKTVLTGEAFDSMSIMYDTVMVPRYDVASLVT